MNILVWHVHGSYMNALVRGAHQYLVPVTTDRGPDGRGRAQSYDWPPSVVEIDRATARESAIDVVVLQRPHELQLADAWLGGRQLPTIYLEHNTPPEPSGRCRHHAIDREDLVVVHVTHTNALYWDTGKTRTKVIEHGIVDPGARYTGVIPHIAAVINDPIRRGPVVGTDLLERFRTAAPLDLFGMQTVELGGYGSLRYDELHRELARRRVYLHTTRWTSLGLSLLEAMYLGMPVVALATTEIPRAVPPHCGVVTNDVDVLLQACRELCADADRARGLGAHARAHALRHYALDRFLADWDTAYEEVAA